MLELAGSNQKLISVGLNYATAPLAVREKLAIRQEELAKTLKNLLIRIGSDETLLLSTCNRTEIYALCDDPSSIIQWFEDSGGISKHDLLAHIYVHENDAAVRHLFRVASGIDSMVLGETQILGQLKSAFRAAKDAGAIGSSLHKLCEQSFSVAKEVRTKTDIGVHSISLGAALVTILERIFPDAHNLKVLLIGAGEMVQLCRDHLVSRGIGSLYFSNRTQSSAEKLALDSGANYMPFGSIHDDMYMFDCIVACTASPIPIIGKDSVEYAIARRKHQPMLIVDLAVPRNIESSVSKLDDVFLFSIDDLEDIVRSNVGMRQSAVQEASRIIDKGINVYSNWIARRNFSSVLRSFRGRGEEIMQAELVKALKKLERGVESEIIIRSLAQSITNKFLHYPSEVLNKDDIMDRELLAQSLVNLFSLKDEG